MTGQHIGRLRYVFYPGLVGQVFRHTFETPGISPKREYATGVVSMVSVNAMTAPDVPILPPNEAPPDDIEPTRDRSCCARIVDPYESGWCVLDNGHPPPCRGTPARFGCERPAPDRKIKSVFTTDVSQKWHHKTSVRVQWLVKWNLPVDILGEI